MEIKENLIAILDSKRVLSNTDVDEKQFKSYGEDRTKVFEPNPSYVVFPMDTKEVSKIVSYAFQNNIKLVPSGGRTGYAGGAIAQNKEIVVSLSKMDKVLDFDPFLGSVSVQSGMITKTVHKTVEERGFYFPVDFAATGSSHIGGNVATNAGGVRVVRYGLIRNWILGLTVVVGTGEVLEFNGNILKNNTGYDLKQLFIGSEGTLGIITEVTLKLTTIPKNTNVLLVATNEFKNILELYKNTHSSTLPLLAFEVFTDYCLGKVKAHLGLNSPFSNKNEYYALLEFETKEETDEEKLYAILEDITEKELILDGSLAQNSRQKETFWKYREGISESLSLGHTVHKNDISIPLREMESFIQKMKELIAPKYNGYEIALFGHIGDGNLHLNIVKPQYQEDKDFFSTCKQIDPLMFELIKSHNGSISAEHGIGLLKKDFLRYSRSDLEIKYMKEMKKVFDPKNVLNPGKVL